MADIFSSAPLLHPFRVKGGTFYTLSSAVRDSSLLFANGNIEISFSKYACLDLPSWQNLTSQSIFFDGTQLQPAVTDPNTVLPKALIQNYIENLQQYSNGSRLNNNFKNFAEAAFWKALKSTKFGGTVEVSTAPPLQFDPTVQVVFDETTGANVNVYKELNDVAYNKVVKYVGDVNMINHVGSAGNEYVEIYAHVPTEAGYQDPILFYPNTIVAHESAQIPAAGGDPDSVVGLSQFKGTDQVEPVYDTNDFKYNVNADIDKVGIWFEDLENNSSKWNKGDFQFNCVLLYYDIFDRTDLTTTQRNLFGILFLDKFVASGGGFTIATLQKFMPDAIQPGNAFGFRFNLKFSADSQQVTSEITINSSSTIAMDLYMDALARLRVVTDEYAELTDQMVDMQQQLDQISQIINTNWQTIQSSSSSIQQLLTRVQSLESSRSNSNDVRISPEDLYRLFQQTIDALKAGGTTPVQNTIIMTSKALLPKLIDKTLLILEDVNGTQYQWDPVSMTWTII